MEEGEGGCFQIRLNHNLRLRVASFRIPRFNVVLEAGIEASEPRVTGSRQEDATRQHRGERTAIPNKNEKISRWLYTSYCPSSQHGLTSHVWVGIIPDRMASGRDGNRNGSAQTHMTARPCSQGQCQLVIKNTRRGVGVVGVVAA
jgi:hypothetical protein